MTLLDRFEADSCYLLAGRFICW